MMIWEGAISQMLTKKPKNAPMVFKVLIKKYDL